MIFTKSKFRAFIALDLKTTERGKITQLMTRLQQHEEFANINNWSGAENLHLTLYFLGDITPKQHKQLVTALTDAIITQADFSIDFTKLALFPAPTKPIALVLSPDANVKLMELQKLVAKTVSACGIKTETKMFLPHITLAKIKSKKVTELPNIELEKIAVKVSGVKLFRSDSNGNGSQYRILNSIIW